MMSIKIIPSLCMWKLTFWEMPPMMSPTSPCGSIAAATWTGEERDGQVESQVRIRLADKLTWLPS